MYEWTNERTRDAAKGSGERMCPLAHARTRYTCVHTQTHMCVRAAEVPAEIQRGPRAPLSKKELTSSPHDEKILHPGGGGGLAQKDHYDVTNVHVRVCMRERRHWEENRAEEKGRGCIVISGQRPTLSFIFLRFPSLRAFWSFLPSSTSLALVSPHHLLEWKRHYQSSRN